MQNLSLAIIASDDGARAELKDAVSALGNRVNLVNAGSSLKECFGLIRQSPPHIVLLDVCEVSQGVKEASAITAQLPQTSVFVTCAHKNPDWILSLIRAGAEEYLTRPVKTQEFLDAVAKVAKGCGFKGEQGSVISVYNPQGGTGTTNIAVNLAATLAVQGKSVALVDLNPLNPDVSTFLDLSPSYTLSTVIDRKGEIDVGFLQTLMVRHRCGVHVLCGPAGIGDADRLEPQYISRLISELRTAFSYTILDIGGALTRCNQQAFTGSDYLLYTTVLSLTSLKNAKRYLRHLDKEAQRVKVVLNRYQQRDEITLKDAEHALGVSVYATLPNAYQETKNAINRGAPLVTSYARSPFTKAMDDLARRLVRESTERAHFNLQQKGVQL